VGISTVSKIFSYFTFLGVGLTQGSWLTYHWMLCNTRNKNIYGLGVGISTVFKIYSYFNFLGFGLTPGVMTNIPLDAM
jgi:hypothetical protein